MILSKFFLIRCKNKELIIPLSTINSVYPVQIIKQSATSKSTIYKLGIRFNTSETALIFKSLFSYSVINDVIKVRSYIFGKKHSYNLVASELKPDLGFLQ